MFKVIPKRAHILVAMELWYVGYSASICKDSEQDFNSTYSYFIF